jgi:hypothetical protein
MGEEATVAEEEEAIILEEVMILTIHIMASMA